MSYTFTLLVIWVSRLADQTLLPVGCQMYLCVCVQMCMLTCTHTGVCLYLQICHTQLDKLNHGLRKI